MDNESRQVRYTNTNKVTDDIISIAICDDEIKFGLPVVTISINNEVTEIPLQDIADIASLINSLLAEIKPFTDREEFERNKIVLKKTTTEKWMQMFEHYHEITEKNDKIED